MATLLAPYNTAMQLGSGFNSYTQQLCVDHAVIRDNDSVDKLSSEHKGPVAQEVAYKSSIVDKVTDVTSAMNINAAFSIKYDTFDAKGKGDFINTSKVKESDVSFMISVKVVNQIVHDHSLTKFNPIPELKSTNFADVYGDCFISGFQEGGEFTAVISVKASDREKADTIKANAAITFTKEKLELGLQGEMDKDEQSFLKENETTISVTWSGGGQDLKKPEEDWSFETIRAAALKFPYLVAATPMRTHVMLTKYTALRSFYSATVSDKATIPNFEKAGVYTALLQESYLDYKTIAKNLQVLAYDVSTGISTLGPAPASEADTPASSTTSSTGNGAGETVHGQDGTAALSKAALYITTSYPPTLYGLEAARNAVRMMLNRIVTEVDVITRSPDLAIDEKRQLPYMSPFLFKELLPVAVLAPEVVPAPTAATTNQAPVENVAGLADMANKSGGTLRF